MHSADSYGSIDDERVCRRKTNRSQSIQCDRQWGATKQALNLGESKDGGFMVGGSEGNVKKGIDLGESKDGGFMVGGSEGAAKKGIQWPEPK